MLFIEVWTDRLTPYDGQILIIIAHKKITKEQQKPKNPKELKKEKEETNTYLAVPVVVIHLAQ